VIGLGIAVVHFLQVQVLVLLQQYQKSIGVAIAILFLKFVLVLPILFKSIVDNPGRAQLLHKFNPRKWWREVKLTDKRAFCSVDQLLSV